MSRKYGSHKSRHTRYLKKVAQLHQLLDKTFDRVMYEYLNSNLQKAEWEIAVLHELADYIVQKKLSKAKEHAGEVIALGTENNRKMEWWRLVTPNAHDTLPLLARRPPPVQDGGGNMKLIGELNSPLETCAFGR